MMSTLSRAWSQVQGRQANSGPPVGLPAVFARRPRREIFESLMSMLLARDEIQTDLVETGIRVQMAGLTTSSSKRLLALCADDNFGRGKCAPHIELALKLSVVGLTNNQRINLLQVVCTCQTLTWIFYLLLGWIFYSDKLLPGFSFRSMGFCRIRTTP